MRAVTAILAIGIFMLVAIGVVLGHGKRIAPDSTCHYNPAGNGVHCSHPPTHAQKCASLSKMARTSGRARRAMIRLGCDQGGR